MIWRRPTKRRPMRSGPAAHPQPDAADLAVLRALRTAGPANSRRLAEITGHTPGGIVCSLRRLAPHGLVRHDRIGSTMIARITDAGRRYAASMTESA